MNDLAATSRATGEGGVRRASGTKTARGIAGLGELILRRLLARVAAGRILIRLPDGRVLAREAASPGPEASIRLHRMRALRMLLVGGDIGFAQSYIDGDWSSSDLPQVVRFALANEAALAGALGAAWPLRMLRAARHRGRRNDRRGARRNIVAHYDLGNAFYASFLDASMTYSSALYRDGEETLEAAQAAKLDRIIELLELRAGARVLEIGCGWGTLASRLVDAGCTVTALTLSPAQAAHVGAVHAGIVAAGRLDVRLQDYRDGEGSYDAIVSIEMLEAVGEENWPVYFERLATLLRRGGRAVVQTISIDAARFAAYRRSPDFIQAHIFPGGMLPSVPVLTASIEAAGLRLVHAEHFGDSYARTLAEWRRRFIASMPSLLADGMEARFARKWEYYLAYCEGGFQAGSIDVGLYVIEHAP